MCATAISFARVRRLYYAAPDAKGGGVEHGPRIYAQPTCHHRPDVYSGIAESESAALLRDFFHDRRCTSLKSRDRKSTRLNSSHSCETRMPSSACKKKTDT